MPYWLLVLLVVVSKGCPAGSLFSRSGGSCAAGACPHAHNLPKNPGFLGAAARLGCSGSWSATFAKGEAGPEVVDPLDCTPHIFPQQQPDSRSHPLPVAKRGYKGLTSSAKLAAACMPHALYSKTGYLQAAILA